MRRHTALPALAVVASVSLAGCGGGDSDPEDTSSAPAGPSVSVVDTSSTPTGPVNTPADTPSASSGSETPATTSGSPSGSPSTQPSVVRRLPDALIPQGDLPGFADSFRWTSERTRPVSGSTPVPICSRSSLVSIGAVKAVRRDYRSDAAYPAYAVQVVAKFPDELTARRTESVLIAWHDRCTVTARERNYTGVEVGDVTQVQTDIGAGTHWLTTYRPVPGSPGRQWYHAEGFVRFGEVLTYLALVTTEQPAPEEPGDEPMAEALGEAADRLSAGDDD